jgi:hypothetical protein
MYSTSDGPLTATLPDGWNPDEVTGLTLSADGKEPATLQREGRRIVVQMRSRQPVMLFRRGVS